MRAPLKYYWLMTRTFRISERADSLRGLVVKPSKQLVQAMRTELLHEVFATTPLITVFGAGKEKE